MKIAVNGNPLVGLYAKVSEEFAVVGVKDGRLISALEERLDVDVIVTKIAGSELVGAMIALNSKGAVVSSYTLSHELSELKRKLDVRVIDTPMTCFGNNLCINERGGIANPEMSDEMVEEISEFLDINLVRGTVGGIKTVGMAAVVTTRGGLANPNINEWELKRLEEVTGVEVLTGTVNFGTDMVGSSLLANSKGYVVGRDTTGFELGIVEEALFP
ncbi:MULTISPECIES: translation initiation factor IF-6 [unclassified Archaeoglobus]|jgi:translation initiation factor 6|uniref:translation initiation factor IF-6 n=1 Tax=unclassified Archaeoglobus TaxID=2643606 RepID=UPI0025BAD0CD|nr:MULTISPECIES: translation initiation factor IF-6 [unclassified Archaeoglobus]